MSRLGVRHLVDADGLPLFSLMDVNRLPRETRQDLYRHLIPEELFFRFGIDRQSFCGPGGQPVIEFLCPQGLGLMRIEVRRSPEERDCIFFVELADTPYQQLELSFCIINDPDAPRFDIDMDETGRDNCFGTMRRNLPEELKAMATGLSPNQVRAGLKLFSDFFARLESFADSLGIDTIVAEPLSYSNALRYEEYGFDYITGKQLMLMIDREFRPGGVLHQRLDGTSQFRLAGMEKTVRGRSWAIHDGVLNQTWDGIKIYKTLGVHAGVNTFPDQQY